MLHMPLNELGRVRRWWKRGRRDCRMHEMFEVIVVERNVPERVVDHHDDRD
jgi:hypothetical protein